MALRRHVLNITLWGCTCDQVLETLSTNIFKCYLLHKTWSELLQNALCWLQNQLVLQIRYTTTALESGHNELPQRVIAPVSSFSLFSIFVRTHIPMVLLFCVSISPFVFLSCNFLWSKWISWNLYSSRCHPNIIISSFNYVCNSLRNL